MGIHTAILSAQPEQTSWSEYEELSARPRLTPTQIENYLIVTIDAAVALHDPFALGLILSTGPPGATACTSSPEQPSPR